MQVFVPLAKTELYKEIFFEIYTEFNTTPQKVNSTPSWTQFKGRLLFVSQPFMQKD